ncbi:hypothetical protein HCUR_00202 [Holospora curviuscula]|uniref:DUF637 domain-containing protein n=2 Tax=Holospora curviuscula TaxID=1082868 RepID=A0A2S5RE14_9PROT|nr:hypothetical protein HCUR_00202 [Holospora curviuscula]
MKFWTFLTQLWSQFKGEVRIEAREKLLLSPALGQDGFEKVSVTRDSKILQKTQARQGQGVDYVECSVQGRLSVDTPHLEVISTTGQRPSGMEIVPRPEFTEIHRTVLPSIIEESQRPRTTFKPAFKAALGVSVAALAGASGGIASGVLAACAQAFIQKGGLESLANHESLQLSDMLKAAGKSLAVQGLSLGDLGSAGNLAKTTAAHSLVYQENPVKILARQGVLQISAAGASEIGQAYRSGLSGLEHKLLHGALAMASTLSFQALESGTGDWNQALLAAGATMAAETCAQGVTEGIRDQLPQRAQGEGQEAYTQRCQEAAQALAGRAVASLRILLATGLALAGKDSGDIQACDTAATTGLEENFVTTILAVAYDVAQGVQEVRDEIQEGNYWSAAGQGALAAGSVALDLASGGVGNTVVKAGVRLARTALSKDKGPGILKKEGGNASGLKATGKQRQEKKAGTQDMTPQEQKAYFERYKDNPVPVGTYKGDKMKKIVQARTKETGLEYEQHHVWPVAQSDELLKVTGRKYKNNTVIPLPKKIHKAQGRKLIHKRNEAFKPQNPRESLLQGVQDTRQGLLDAGCDRMKTNEACLEALKKIKADNPERFSGKIPPKP